MKLLFFATADEIAQGAFCVTHHAEKYTEVAVRYREKAKGQPKGSQRTAKEKAKRTAKGNSERKTSH